MNSNVGTIIRLTGSIVDTPLEIDRQAKRIQTRWHMIGKPLFYKINRPMTFIVVLT